MIAENSRESLPVAERIIRLLDHLGIERAHVAAFSLADWKGLLARYTHRVASLTLFCHDPLNARLLQKLDSRLLLLSGDKMPGPGWIEEQAARIPRATHVALHGYHGRLWDDVAKDHGAEIAAAIAALTAAVDQKPAAVEAITADSGAVAGITYRLRGSGEPLLLMPLGLAPSQWAPLLPSLARRYGAIELGGPELGFIPPLEARGRSRGYLRIVRTLIEEMQLQAGETILDVGCGTGVIDRWLAAFTGGANTITGVDISPYLLQEAEDFARAWAPDLPLSFQQGNAEALPFPNDTYDLAISSTVMEEVDAHKMLAEMIRVTRPGGRVGVIVRATDMPWMVNLPLQPEFRAKLEGPGEVMEGSGSASVSLYRHFQDSILQNVIIMPQLAVFADPEGGAEKYIEEDTLSWCSAREAEDWRRAMSEARAEGTYFFTWPHHSAVGTKPA